MPEARKRPPSVSTFDIPLGAVIDVAREAIVVTDDDQCIVAVNAAGLALFGYTQREIVGRPLERLIPQRLHAAHAAHVRDFEASGKAHLRTGGRVPVIGLRKDGSEFPIEAAVSRVDLAGPDGSRTCYVTMLCDLVPWAVAPGQMDAPTRRFRELLDLAPVALWC